MLARSEGQLSHLLPSPTVFAWLGGCHRKLLHSQNCHRKLLRLKSVNFPKYANIERRMTNRQFHETMASWLVSCIKIFCVIHCDWLEKVTGHQAMMPWLRETACECGKLIWFVETSKHAVKLRTVATVTVNCRKCWNCCTVKLKTCQNYHTVQPETVLTVNLCDICNSYDVVNILNLTDVTLGHHGYFTEIYFLLIIKAS